MIRHARRTITAAALATAAVAALAAQTAPPKTLTIDLSKETVGKAPQAFEPEMGTWVIAMDGADKVIKVDGAAYKDSLSTPERLLLGNARKLYGTTNEELMDNAKQFTVFPIAVLRKNPAFSSGTIAVKFKTLGGEADRASGILFNLKPNGDWLCLRYNDTESNLGLWEFHAGMRRLVKFSDRATPYQLDRAAWHTLVLTVDGARLTGAIDGVVGIDYTLGTEPGPGRNGAPPHPDLFPANNPVLRPPVSGRVGLWSKSDSTVAFKDFVVTAK